MGCGRITLLFLSVVGLIIAAAFCYAVFFEESIGYVLAPAFYLYQEGKGTITLAINFGPGGAFILISLLSLLAAGAKMLTLLSITLVLFALFGAVSAVYTVFILISWDITATQDELFAFSSGLVATFGSFLLSYFTSVTKGEYVEVSEDDFFIGDDFATW